MARRRSFFAELQHQAKIVEREQLRAQRDAERAHREAIRRAEQARKAEERAAAKLARAREAERKQLEKELRQAHVEAMEQEVEGRNADIANRNDELASLLQATLEVDDYVDLDTLRQAAKHPPFSRPELENPIPTPSDPALPPRPILVRPPEPTGLLGIVKKRSHEKAVAKSKLDYDSAIVAWEQECERVFKAHQPLLEEHRVQEDRRKQELSHALAKYKDECARRETEVAEQNKSIDTLIANLSYGDVDAVQEYVSIVLSNSVYPDHFEVVHDFEFAPSQAELTLRALIPPPSALSDVKAYKYTKSKDEITSTSMSQKDQRDRYLGAIEQVALRTLHEVFEADRRGIIKTISLEVGTETIDPATGRETYVPFVATGAEREAFLSFNLENVVPSATLAHLGAVVSKKPFDLVAVDTSGVRRS